ncbi:zinc ribbon domain-containing protein [Archangium lipolyticum]|uniref:zinc ribbon domain-containing protein n=1 Tax=Archangium lipolyticum TaxID=2970465 RepID=UPI00214A6508|nr:zinc ribbon domain-containing protein [Archangium lipolyticum]
MQCSNCGHSVTDEAHSFCTECGEPLKVPGDEAASTGDESYGSEDYNAGDYAGDYSWEEPPPPPSLFARMDEALSKVLAPVKDVAGQTWEAIQGVMDDPRLRSRLPGGSLTLLGLACVGLALLLSVIPFVAGIGFLGSGVMLLGGLLVAINEWRILSQPGTQEFRTANARTLPASLENLPEETQHPAIAQAYAALTLTHALLMLGTGLVSLLWLLAALVLGYEQGRRFFVSPELDHDPDAGNLRQRLDRWVVVGVVVCSFSLLLPWARGHMPMLGPSGGEQPLATFTQLTLVLLACFALRHRGLSSLHPIVLVIMAVWLTMWFFLMMSPYTVGPWFFLPGLLTLDAVIVLHLFQLRRSGQAAEVSSDLDYRG